MSFFPISINLEDKSVLVIGGGKVALRKIKTLLKFDIPIIVISPHIIEDLKSLLYDYDYDSFDCNVCNHKVKLYNREFSFNDLKLFNVGLVITTTDDVVLNQNILDVCKSKGILCNSATNTQNNGYLFPSIVKEGDISIAINTDGKSPYISRKIREDIQKNVPLDKYNQLVEQSNSLRKKLLNFEDSQEIRAEIIKSSINENFS
ncbi:MAG: bifunctional precorrin-2 dehydrogenase/sirohydrochlorin ferrochelatase [Oscillospiraceae bacterium]